MSLQATPSRPRPPHRRGYALVPLLALAAGACSPGDGDNDEGGRTEAFAPDTVIRRDRAAGQFALGLYPDARATLAPLVAPANAAVEDLVRAASVEFELDQHERALAFLERAFATAPDDAGVQWGLYRYRRQLYELEAALAHVRKVHAARPDDIPAIYALAITLNDLADEGSRPDLAAEAAQRYEELIALGPDYAGSWLAGALYRYATFFRNQGRMEDFDSTIEEYKRYERRGVQGPSDTERLRGNLGIVAPGRPGQLGVSAPPELAQPEARRVLELAGARGMRLVRVDRGPIDKDRFLLPARVPGGEPIEGKVAAWEPAPTQLLVWGPAGLVLAERGADGAWTSAAVLAGDVTAVAPCDVNTLGKDGLPTLREGRLDLVVTRRRTEGGSELLFLERRDDWRPLAAPLALLEGDVHSLIAVDDDHDGDLDLVVAHGETVTLLRNDGFGVSPTTGEPPSGAFTLVPDAAPWPAGARSVVAEDLDGDNDLDFVVLGAPDGAPQRPVYLSSERSKGFVPTPRLLPDVASLSAGRSLLHDLDQDGQADVVDLAGGRLLRRTPGGGWREPEGPLPLGSPAGPARGADWDLDGTVDLLVPLDAGLSVTQAAGFVDWRKGSAWDLGGPTRACATGDLDGDFDQDLLLLREDGLYEALQAGAGRGLQLELLGEKDNPRGVGATVELRAGTSYRRIYWDGGTELLGLGDAPEADVLRITWPNGVVQTEVALAGGASWLVAQRKGLVGSCPFLYAWNGTSYEFVSDVIGITPLGLPMAPGMLVPPDHDEYVLVRGEQLAPRDGFLDLQFTEELREVTYLDRARLDVVDHPEGVEVFPNERFTFPPFPEAHTHTVKDALAPVRATGSDGRDWTATLAAKDGELASPFTPYDGQFLGLANPHWLELAFDPERVRGAQKLRLVMTGWLFWTDASVNMAAARTPGIDFVPPLLQVPDGNGNWVENGPPLGFPAGKLKTMVVDVTGRIDPADPRLRIFSTLRLYWDSIRLAVDDDDAPLQVTSIEPASAVLWERGFSEPVPLHGAAALDWFEWDRVSDVPRWNQHPGLYTRYGECVELLGAVDDRYVIMGAGDALRVRFPAADLPPLRAGWRRDYVLFLDGWAKDRDPNSHEAEFVEPLPFHGMSGYPYGADEHFPTSPEHQAWRREWNTRPAKRWIAPLRPAAQAAAVSLPAPPRAARAGAGG